MLPWTSLVFILVGSTPIKNMASGYSFLSLGSEDGDIACDVCKAQNIPSRAVSYCNLCTDTFCLACEKVHRASNLTKDHKLLTGAQFQAIAIGSRRIPSIMICDQHHLLISRFCKDHSAVFCQTCETIYHRACNTEDIKKHASTPETSLELSKLHDKLTELERKYTEFEKKREDDKTALKTKIKDCMDEVDKVRKDVNTILDGLEKNMKAQVQEVERKISKEIEDHLTITKNMLKQIIENTKMLKECGETQQTDAMFVGIKKVENVIQEYDDTSKQIEKEIAELDIDFKPDDLFSVSMGQLTSLGELNVRRWQRHVSYLNLSVGDVKRHHVGSMHVRSIVFLPDGLVVLVCHEVGLKLLDEKFRPISQLPKRAIRACLVSNTEVLVSLGREAQIQFVEVKPMMKIKDTIKFERICMGVDFHNDEIYVACHDGRGNGEVRVLDRAGHIQRKLGYDGTQYKFTLPWGVKVTMDGHRIIVTDYHDHSVTCLNQQGHVVYKYTDGDLKDPHGLILDGEGNAMVCGFDSRNVLVISADGQKQRVLLNEDDKISHPICISYRQTDGCLAVGMFNVDGYSMCVFATRKCFELRFSSFNISRIENTCYCIVVADIGRLRNMY